MSDCLIWVNILLIVYIECCSNLIYHCALSDFAQCKNCGNAILKRKFTSWNLKQMNLLDILNHCKIRVYTNIEWVGDEVWLRKAVR